MFAGSTTVPTNRMRLFCSSAISTSPAGVTPTALGTLICATAGPPSPVYPRVPSPIRVLMTPSEADRRTRSFDASAIRKPPSARATTLWGPQAGRGRRTAVPP